MTTDVFDTLLLRTWQSERSRLLKGERLFSKELALEGLSVPADLLLDARLRAQRLAFRALDVRGLADEVRLIDIVGRQLAILGLPGSLATQRMTIELEVEKQSLVANPTFGDVLNSYKRRGVRVVAVSDTTLSGDAVKALIEHFYGPELIDSVYSSADCGMTKRRGDIFAAVAEREAVSPTQMLHFGDDPVADVRVPSKRGIKVQHTPRGVHRTYARQANGALAEARRAFDKRGRAASCQAYQDAQSFGRTVLGPIVTELSLSVWLYAAQADTRKNSALLFCARGGIGMREAFERVVAKLSLRLDMRRENLMISRLVAARAALLTGHGSAIEELDREFHGSTFADVARALGGGTYALSGHWHQPFRARELMGLLTGPCGADVLADIENQNTLFMRHLDFVAGDADVLILCDTGLYGSTQRLLASALPDGRVETIQFARANYKGHDEAHFAKTTGLLVQQKYFSPLNVQSSVLRYWHLIESLFEPAVASVRLFKADDGGRVSANCGHVDFGAIDPSDGNPLLAGALAYIDALPQGAGAAALRDAETAWPRLKRAICRPTATDLRSLAVGPRSIDFGRAETIEILGPQLRGSLLARLFGVQRNLWREGAITLQFPALKHLLLPLLDAVLCWRGIVKR